MLVVRMKKCDCMHNNNLLSCVLPNVVRLTCGSAAFQGVVPTTAFKAEPLHLQLRLAARLPSTVATRQEGHQQGPARVQHVMFEPVDVEIKKAP